MDSVRVLITNDDGIRAPGIQALREALVGIDGVDVEVVAPDSNRSATARSITTHSPLWVEEVPFPDGTTGFATDGTPVDCVRIAELGLVEERPELIVSGINHGVNLGDDVTYSGTVAAALEGVVLGIPAIALSQQANRGSLGFAEGPREFDFTFAANLAAELVRSALKNPLTPGTLINVNVPAGEVDGIEVTKLGKREYDDKLEWLEDGPDGRRRYRIYGIDPGHRDEPGTDLAAVARHRASLTPLHFDLTAHHSIESLRQMDLESIFRNTLAAGGVKAG